MRQFISRYKRLIIISIALITLGITLWETNVLLQEFKAEKKAKMEILAAAYQKLIESKGDDVDLLNLTLSILEKNQTIPIIILDKNNEVKFHRNLKKEDPDYLLKKTKEFKKKNKPLILDLGGGEKQYLYYGDSSLINKLTYYPVILILVFFLFAGIIYQYYRTGKISDENRLWSGLAKETAHQIGTPLSSLMGWVEILKMQDNLDIPVEEIEKDVQRLNIISQRFSKIGSTPKLEKSDVVDITKKTINYIKNRTSKLVTIQLESPEKVTSLLNEQLYSWVIENLIKNAIDAMGGKGQVTIRITPENNTVFIDISDTGKGIPASKYKAVFNPIRVTPPKNAVGDWVYHWQNAL